MRLAKTTTVLVDAGRFTNAYPSVKPDGQLTERLRDKIGCASPPSRPSIVHTGPLTSDLSLSSTVRSWLLAIGRVRHATQEASLGWGPDGGMCARSP